MESHPDMLQSGGLQQVSPHLALGGRLKITWLVVDMLLSSPTTDVTGCPGLPSSARASSSWIG